MHVVPFAFSSLTLLSISFPSSKVLSSSCPLFSFTVLLSRGTLSKVSITGRLFPVSSFTFASRKHTRRLESPHAFIPNQTSEQRMGSLYLHHCGELHRVAPPASSETNTSFSRFPSCVNSAIITCAIATPSARTIIKPSPIVAISLKVLERKKMVIRCTPTL